MLVNVTIPVYNEVAQLAASVETVLGFLEARRDHRYEIVIAENASTDGTAALAADLALHHPSVRVLQLDRKGRGGAIKRAWRESEAEILTYMDVDLSTSLKDFWTLVDPIADGTADLTTGSRLLPNSQVTRSWSRGFLSRSYSLIARIAVPVPCRDLQCGFKAISRRAAQVLLPLVEDDGWFFDTELLHLAAESQFRVQEIPVTWIEDPDSRVRILRTAWDDLRGLARLRARRRTVNPCTPGPTPAALGTQPIPADPGKGSVD